MGTSLTKIQHVEMLHGDIGWGDDRETLEGNGRSQWMWTMDGETLDGDIGLREAEGCRKKTLDGEITNTSEGEMLDVGWKR